MPVYSWPGEMEAQFNRKISDEEATAWQSRFNFMRATDHELCQAITMCAEERWQGRHTFKNPINVRDVMAWVRRFRTVNTVSAEHQRRLANLQRLKREIDQTTDNDLLWAYICEPPKAEDCADLEKHCRYKHPHFKRPEGKFSEISRRLTDAMKKKTLCDDWKKTRKNT